MGNEKMSPELRAQVAQLKPARKWHSDEARAWDAAIDRVLALCEDADSGKLPARWMNDASLLAGYIRTAATMSHQSLSEYLARLVSMTLEMDASGGAPTRACEEPLKVFRSQVEAERAYGRAASRAQVLGRKVKNQRRQLRQLQTHVKLVNAVHVAEVVRRLYNEQNRKG